MTPVSKPPVWRSQFVIGRALPDLSEDNLQRRTLGGLDIWVGPDLSVEEIGPVVVLGFAASTTESDLQTHFANVSVESNEEEIAELSLDLTGRFVVVAALEKGVVLLTDGIGSKRVFLSADAEVASSSEQLLTRVGSRPNRRSRASFDLLADVRLPRREYATFGLESIFSGYGRLPVSYTHLTLPTICSV